MRTLFIGAAIALFYVQSLTALTLDRLDTNAGALLVDVEQLQQAVAAAQEQPKPATNGAAAVTPPLAATEPKWTQERTDLVDLAVTKMTLLQTRVQALQAEITAQQKEANEVMKRANDEMVKACGKTTDTHDFDFQKRLCVEKPKK